MAVTLYQSSDASAPVLSGQVGAWIGVLDACLVNGYGAKSAAGWAKAFTGTNLAAYRAASGNRLYLAVDDTNAQEARFVGYETMSAVTTGTNPFPTTAQVSGGMYMRKSETANSTARPWVLIASDTGFMFFPDSNGTTWSTDPAAIGCSGQMYYGDLVSYKPSDAYGTIIIGATATAGSNSNFGRKSQQGVITWAADAGHYLARNQAQSVGSIACSKWAPMECSPAAQMGVNAVSPYPDTVSGGLIISPILISETNGGTGQLIRGRLPGVWNPCHNLPAAHADTMTGSGDTSGKSFLLASAYVTSTKGRAILETSNTW